ncbi:hypothetical protein DFH09DRAFT_1090392 [Mycena vulgaris]|nr:hypothetical protein DFH09DRAFT_1090392 [Mycena vulgaris]
MTQIRPHLAVLPNLDCQIGSGAATSVYTQGSIYPSSTGLDGPSVYMGWERSDLGCGAGVQELSSSHSHYTEVTCGLRDHSGNESLSQIRLVASSPLKIVAIDCCGGKDYDPYSQDIARELGYPLFQVVSESDAQDLSEKDESEKKEDLSRQILAGGSRRGVKQPMKHRDELMSWDISSSRLCLSRMILQDLSEEDESEKKEDISGEKYLREVVAEDSALNSSLGRENFHPLDNGELEPSRTWKIIIIFIQYSCQAAFEFDLVFRLSVDQTTDEHRDELTHTRIKYTIKESSRFQMRRRNFQYI